MKAFDIAILGGGISGLACGHWLQKYRPEQSFCLWEAGPRPGGRISSRRVDGYLLEAGPDCFVRQRPAMNELIRDLGLETRACASSPQNAGTYVQGDTRLQELPPGLHLGIPSRPWLVALSPLLSLRGKLRLALEAWVPRRLAQEDESVGSFVRRRLGEEALQKLIGPLLGGIFGTDLDQLSLRATFAHLAEYEQKFGSLTRALWQNPVPSSAGNFYSFPEGMQELIDALEARLDQRICTSTPVQELRYHDGLWEALSRSGNQLRARQVVLALPGAEAARLLRDCAPELSRALARLQYSSAAAVHLGWTRRCIGHSLRGYGLVSGYPARRPLVACTWSSQKFAGRAPQQAVLMRAFMRDSEYLRVDEADDQHLLGEALAALRKPLLLHGEPNFWKVERYTQAFPNYTTGHLERMRSLDAQRRQLPGLHWLGAAYAAGGVPACVTQARHWVEGLACV
ncbi:MAG: protoporphyrinogen oxidase [Candidatus Eremiobacteraeota bacterium]|nr:protoporphyrinogen oxidase [Candidatus Eremiobacteraeota bacterium]MCW5869878.1 protoporphyrinogen oxidase [Candidatus Eremiobacteraeota bacterium]